MSERRALVSIDLGAESCRVSLLDWRGGGPEIRMVRRFANGPVERGDGLFWDIERILSELEAGLAQCAEAAPQGVASIGVTGWAVDYTRLDGEGRRLGLPHCYRDPRNRKAMDALHRILPEAELYARTGVQIQPINTVYQLYADQIEGVPPGSRWVNLPEYVLHWLGAPRVAEYTNASHTGLVDPQARQWSETIFATLGMDPGAAPSLVAPGAALGPLREDLRRIPALAAAELIAPACHDTASAVAGIPARDEDWAYISSGTWSLVGIVDDQTHRSPEACAAGFTNLGAAGGGVLFHRGLVGMWLLRQSMNGWENEGDVELGALIAEARRLPPPDAPLDLDDARFVTPGDMPARMNEQRRSQGLSPLPEGREGAPAFASLIFHSLAYRYGIVLGEIEHLTGKRPRRICVVGGGNRNEYLNALTEAATGLPVERCAAESSTLGNFAIQWARIDRGSDGVTAAEIAAKARALMDVPMIS